MRRVLVFVLCCAACSNSEEADAKARVLRHLSDSSAAQFRNVVVVGDTLRTVCGEVNSRDAAGGNTGFKRFALSLRDSTSLLLEKTGAIPDLNWDLMCTPPGAKRDSLMAAWRAR